MNEEFDILTVKILAGEASTDEQARLEQLMEQNAELRRDFADLKAAWDSVREIGPLAQAMEASSCSIPSARLSRLQTAVKRKFAPTPLEDSIAQPGQSGRQAQSDSRRSAPADNAVFGNEARSVVAIVRQWITETIGLAPRGVAVALLVLTAVAVGILLNKRWKTAPAAGGETQIIAYLMGGDVEPDVRRAGRPINTSPGAPLLASDEVLLSSGAKIRLITPNGLLELSGPAMARAGNLLTNRDDQTQPSNDLGAFIKETDAMRVALFRPAKQLLATTLLVTTRGGQSIPLYSPLGSTAYLTPLILWKGEPGKTYDLAITDEFDQKSKPLRLSGVVPPIEFTTVEAWKGRSFAKNGLYRINLIETGKPLSASEYTFRTVEAPDGLRPGAPVDRLLRAFQIFKAEPSRMGDALADLLALPEETADSELALRLKLLAFAQLGYQADFDSVAARLRTADATR